MTRPVGLFFCFSPHTRGCLLYTSTQDEKTSYVTYRHYLQDAVFLAGIESEDAALLQQLQQAPVSYTHLDVYKRQR